MRKHVLTVVAISVTLGVVAASAVASGYLITSVHQIKPTVLKHLRGPQGAPGATGADGVVPALVTVISEKLTLAPGETTYDADPNNFLAPCPTGESVVGTGFDAGGVGSVGFVESFDTFVGGFMANESSVTTEVWLQAICGEVTGGSSGQQAADPGTSPTTAYHNALRAAEAAHRG